MAVAHEIDPLNGDWVAKWNHWHGSGHYVYAESVLEHRSRGRLYPIETILESSEFDLAYLDASM
jgi:hypothetical protein